VTNAHPAIQVYALCAAMEWSHLPRAGGIYDQDPDLLDGFREIFAAQAEHDSNEARKQERKSKAASRGRRH